MQGQRLVARVEVTKVHGRIALEHVDVGLQGLNAPAEVGQCPVQRGGARFAN